MGLLDGAKNLADNAIDAIGGDKVKDGVDAATDKADEATGGASSAAIVRVDVAGDGVVDELANN